MSLIRIRLIICTRNLNSYATLKTHTSSESLQQNKIMMRCDIAVNQTKAAFTRATFWRAIF